MRGCLKLGLDDDPDALAESSKGLGSGERIAYLVLESGGGDKPGSWAGNELEACLRKSSCQLHRAKFRPWCLGLN